jgi:hypothetical protein
MICRSGGRLTSHHQGKVLVASICSSASPNQLFGRGDGLRKSWPIAVIGAVIGVANHWQSDKSRS